MDVGFICVGPVFILGGLFILAAVTSRWGWYMNHPRVREYTARFGETEAARHQIALGAGLVIAGVLMIGWFVLHAMGVAPQ